MAKSPLLQEGLGAACLDPQPEPRQFVVPKEQLTLSRRKASPTPIFKAQEI